MILPSLAESGVLVRVRQYKLQFFFAQETALGSKEMLSCLNEFNPQNYVKKQKQSQAWWYLLIISVQGR